MFISAPSISSKASISASKFPRSRLACALTLAVFSWSVMATGLGELSAKSNLGSRLLAQVPVLGIDAADTEQLKASLAGVAAYEAMGLEFPSILFKVKVEVSNVNGVPTLTLSSSEFVTEPILDVVLRLDGPGGKVQRHYTLLLDLPGETVAAMPLIPAAELIATNNEQTPISQAVPQAGAVEQSVVRERKKRPSVTKPSAIAEGAMSYGPVQAGESLWTIAGSLRSRYGLKQQAMMNAILANNPSAFINGDEDQLKVGAELKLPALAGAAANAEIAAPVTNSIDAASQIVAETGAEASARLTGLNEQNQQLRSQLTALSARIAELEQRLAAPDASAAPEPATLSPIAMSAAAPEPVGAGVLEAPSATDDAVVSATAPAAQAALIAASAPEALVATPAPVDTAVTAQAVRIETARATVNPLIWAAGGALAVIGLAGAFWWYRQRKVTPAGFDDQTWSDRKRQAREQRHAQQQGLMDSGVLTHGEARPSSAMAGGAHDAIDIKLQYVRSAVDTFMMFQRYREALSFLRREISEAGGIESPLGQRIDALLRDTKAQMDSMGVSEAVPDGSAKPALASERSIDDERSVVTPLRQRNRLK